MIDTVKINILIWKRNELFWGKFSATSWWTAQEFTSTILFGFSLNNNNTHIYYCYNWLILLENQTIADVRWSPSIDCSHSFIYLFNKQSVYSPKKEHFISKLSICVAKSAKLIWYYQKKHSIFKISNVHNIFDMYWTIK